MAVIRVAETKSVCSTKCDERRKEALAPCIACPSLHLPPHNTALDLHCCFCFGERCVELFDTICLCPVFPLPVFTRKSTLHLLSYWTLRAFTRFLLGTGFVTSDLPALHVTLIRTRLWLTVRTELHGLYGRKRGLIGNLFIAHITAPGTIMYNIDEVATQHTTGSHCIHCLLPHVSCFSRSLL